MAPCPAFASRWGGYGLLGICLQMRRICWCENCCDPFDDLLHTQLSIMPSGAGAASNSGSKNLDSRKRGRAEKRKFVFASFTARLTALSLDVLHQDRSSFTQEDKGTFALHFTSEVERWRELNFATPFLWFCRQVNTCSSTLPLLLHNKRLIFDKLCEALAMPNLGDGSVHYLVYY
jgi:hypothetical protein